MGAWNYGVFDDDTAYDALDDLKASKDMIADMEKYFDAVIGAEYVGYDEGHYALVSAAVIDSVLGGTQYRCDGDDYFAWTKTLKSLDFAPLKPKAIAAIDAVLSDRSELKELWEENEELYSAWREDKFPCGKDLDNIHTRTEKTIPMSNSRVSTWSGIRNKLENDYLCPALRGHIQYFATRYSKSADHVGRAAIRMDGVEVLRSNHYTYFENLWTKFHQLRSTTLKDRDCAKEAFDRAHAYALEQGAFDRKVFYEAFGIFDNQSIEKSLVSENPLVRIFALLDRRLGKRRLLALEESMEQEPDWVRIFYVIRMQAEGLMENE